jgi:dienelactone hydrolase
MAIESRWVEYTHNGTLLEGYLAWDTAVQGKRPAVLVAHPWAGRGTFTEEKARLLAEAGYVGFALDMYGKGVVGTTTEECSALMSQQLADRKAVQGRMLAALASVRQQAEVDAGQVAAIGYCFGGLCVLDLVRSGEAFAGAISFHGLLGAPEHPTHTVNAPVLILHGYDDPLAPPEQLERVQQELSAAKADWQVHAFGGVMHAFTNPAANNPDGGMVYHGRSDERSWRLAMDFLREVLAE